MNVQIVSFRCILKNKLGHMISTSVNEDVATSVSSMESASDVSGPLPGLIEALKNLRPGEKSRIYVSAEKAYGFYLPELSIEVSRSRLKNGKDLKVGDHVMGRMRGDTQNRAYRVTATTQRHVTLDGNHPLAGQDLVFDVELTSSRQELDTEVALPPRYC